MTENQRHGAFYPDAYRAARERIEQLVRDRPENAGQPVAACPGWAVRDLVGHLLQVCRSVVAEEPGEISEPRAPEPDTSLPDLLTAWSELDAKLTEVLRRASGLRPRVMLLDVVSHELDIRHALGVPASVEQAAFSDVLDLATMGFGLSVGGHALPALRIETPEQQWLVGSGEPAVTVRGQSLDVFRSLTGRRTVAQISALHWSAEPQSWLAAFTWGPFAPPQHEVEEVASG